MSSRRGRRIRSVLLAALAAFTVAPDSIASAAGAPASTGAVREFGAPQAGLALGIRARTVALQSGVHVVVDASVQNEGRVTLAITPLDDVQFRVLDATGTPLHPRSACLTPAPAPAPVVYRLRPGASMDDGSAIDLACYDVIQSGAQYTIAMLAEGSVDGAPSVSSNATLILVSNSLHVSIPEGLPIANCLQPNVDATAAKVAPLQSAEAAAQDLAGVVIVGVSLGASGSVQRAAVYKRQR